jgi:hypothetical protein
MQPSATGLLWFMSFCDRLATSEESIRADYADDTSNYASDFEEVLATLFKFSFIGYTAGPRTWEMHRLVRDADMVSGS